MCAPSGRYDGDADVFIINCPTDDRADEECLIKWLKEGILDEDKMYQDAIKDIDVSGVSVLCWCSKSLC